MIKKKNEEEKKHLEESSSECLLERALLRTHLTAEPVVAPRLSIHQCTESKHYAYCARRFSLNSRVLYALRAGLGLLSEPDRAPSETTKVRGDTDNENQNEMQRSINSAPADV